MKKDDKKLKKILQKKLKPYSAAAGAVLAVGGAANSQVAYTDIDPDENNTATETLYTYDINFGGGGCRIYHT